MTAHNAEPFIQEAVHSIQVQTWTDWELVVVDDASTDHTKTLLDEISQQDARVRVYHRDKCGRSEALNEAMMQAQAPMVAILDADDRAVPDRLAVQIEHLNRHPEIALVGGAVQYIRERTLTNLVEPVIESPHEIRRVLSKVCCIAHSTVMMRKSCALEVGGYRTGYPPSEDYDLWLRMSERYDMANLPKVMVHYRVHGAQLSSTQLRSMAIATLAAQADANARRTDLSRRYDHPSQFDSSHHALIPKCMIELQTLRMGLARSDLLERMDLLLHSRQLREATVAHAYRELGLRATRSELAWHDAFRAWRSVQRLQTVWLLTQSCILSPRKLSRLIRGRF